MRFVRHALLGCGLLGMAVGLPALAQQNSSTYPAPCDAARVSKSDVERAHTVFLSGKQFLEESNYDKAISYFGDAYSIDCSVHAILPIIATAYERKGDKGEAIRALQEYVKRVPTAQDREVIERRIRNLTDQLAREPAATASGAAAPSAGSSPAQSASPESAVTTPPVLSGAAPTSSGPPEQPQQTAEAGSHHSAAPWVLVGLGGAALVAGGVVYGIGASDVASASNACPTRSHCTGDAASQGNTGRTLDVVGGALLGGGAAVLAAGLIWHFVEGGGSGRAGVQVAPVVMAGYRGVGVTGSF